VEVLVVREPGWLGCDETILVQSAHSLIGAARQSFCKTRQERRAIADARKGGTIHEVQIVKTWLRELEGRAPARSFLRRIRGLRDW